MYYHNMSEFHLCSLDTDQTQNTKRERGRVERSRLGRCCTHGLSYRGILARTFGEWRAGIIGILVGIISQNINETETKITK